MPPKKKVKHNISGLLNQRQMLAAKFSHEDARASSTQPDLISDDENDRPDEEWVLNVNFDNNKVKWDDESGSEDDIDSENEEDFLDSD